MHSSIFSTMEKVSNDGVITIEESKTMKTELDLVVSSATNALITTLSPNGTNFII